MRNFVAYKLKEKPHNVLGHDYKSLSISDDILKIETISEATRGDVKIKTIELPCDSIAADNGNLCIWIRS